MADQPPPPNPPHPFPAADAIDEHTKLLLPEDPPEDSVTPASIQTKYPNLAGSGQANGVDFIAVDPCTTVQIQENVCDTFTRMVANADLKPPARRDPIPNRPPPSDIELVSDQNFQASEFANAAC